jgi:hypothetical protein
MRVHEFAHASDSERWSSLTKQVEEDSEGQTEEAVRTKC